MPQFGTELTQGQTFSRTSDEGEIKDSAQRVYKIILSHPAEVFDPQFYTGTYIGSRHPFNTNLVCCSVDAKFEGESRMVSIVTFNYRRYASSSSSSGRKDPKTTKPTERPANWTTDTSLMETPCDSWRRWESNGAVKGRYSYPANPMFDRYDGVSKLVPITKISVEQYEPLDPLNNTMWVGFINKEVMWIGGYQFPRHTVMLRGVNSKPHVEMFGSETFRGWIATYDFAHRMNMVDPPGSGPPQPIGWDRLQPLEGLYVKNDRLGDDDVDSGGLSLEHADYKVQVTAGAPQPYAYAAGSAGKRMRAMVGFPCPTGGWAQRPSASPIALNEDGTPRNLKDNNPDGTPKRYPIVWRYQVQPDVDLVSQMNLRLF